MSGDLPLFAPGFHDLSMAALPASYFPVYRGLIGFESVSMWQPAKTLQSLGGIVLAARAAIIETRVV